MRTISKNQYERMIVQAEEADSLGLTKISENLTKQIEKNSIREDVESYTYASEDYMKDVEENLWNIIVRTADFHGVSINAENSQKLVEYFSEKISESIRKELKVKTSIGSYEPKLPGEDGNFTLLEIEG